MKNRLTPRYPYGNETTGRLPRDRRGGHSWRRVVEQHHRQRRDAHQGIELAPGVERNSHQDLGRAGMAQEALRARRECRSAPDWKTTTRSPGSACASVMRSPSRSNGVHSGPTTDTPGSASPPTRLPTGAAWTRTCGSPGRSCPRPPGGDAGRLSGDEKDLTPRDLAGPRRGTRRYRPRRPGSGRADDQLRLRQLDRGPLDQRREDWRRWSSGPGAARRGNTDAEAAAEVQHLHRRRVRLRQPARAPSS